jgi:hypothetical protein
LAVSLPIPEEAPVMNTVFIFATPAINITFYIYSLFKIKA